MQINPFNANFEQLADVAQSHKTSKSLVRQLVKFLIIIIQFPKEGYLQYELLVAMEKTFKIIEK